jgi:hypothetical protein
LIFKNVFAALPAFEKLQHHINTTSGRATTTPDKQKVQPKKRQLRHQLSMCNEIFEAATVEEWYRRNNNNSSLKR